MKPSVLYAMASWSGPRQGTSLDDSHVQKHVNQLRKLKHNITQISIGNPANPTRRLEFQEYMDSINGSDAHGTPIVVHDFPNAGRSYGQWSRIYDKYRTQFDYYIFVEDDYPPAIDDLDRILVEMYDQQHRASNVGFLCGLVLDHTGRYALRTTELHAGITNGIASSKVLEKVRERFVCLPHDMFGYQIGQVIFSKGFIEAGFKLGEYIASGEYRSLYYQHNDTIRIYGSTKNGKDIFVPTQVLGRENQFKYVHYMESDRAKPKRASEKSVIKPIIRRG